MVEMKGSPPPYSIICIQFRRHGVVLLKISDYLYEKLEPECESTYYFLNQ